MKPSPSVPKDSPLHTMFDNDGEYTCPPLQQVSSIKESGIWTLVDVDERRHVDQCKKT